jgi:drug/metabolite transporter (DMT)-like permease
MTTSLLLLALISPLIYAATNHLDNILLQKYFKEGGVGTLILFSSLFSVFALPVFYFIDPNVLGSGGGSILLLMTVGLLNVILIWFYLKALFTDEPTVVILYYQLVPVIGLVSGYFLLGETISEREAWAMGVIILGASLLTVAMNEDGKIELRLKTAYYMLIASVCWASESTLFKLAMKWSSEADRLQLTALESNVWRSLFWEHVALVLIGILIYWLAPHYRNSFNKTLKLNSVPILVINVVNEIAYIAANSIAAFVVARVVVPITLLMNSFQPAFVLLMGIVLKYSLPNLEVEHVNGRNKFQKATALLLTVVGVCLLEPEIVEFLEKWKQPIIDYLYFLQENWR